VIGVGDNAVGTVEHVLAAVYASGVDDLIVEVDGPEPPVGDGSARGFFQAIESVGVEEREIEQSVIRVSDTFTVVEGEAEYVVAPFEKLRVTVNIEWDHPLIGRQSGCYDISPESFADSLAGARTFGFKDEVNELRGRGLARGASESTVIVLTEKGMVGPGLRWPDEFVRHKAVDLVGDLALLGAQIEADIVALRPNHKGNVALARSFERTARMEKQL
jgi:UDP-3-O-acyl N-acetylglucosamine deacetylase